MARSRETADVATEVPVIMRFIRELRACHGFVVAALVAACGSSVQFAPLGEAGSDTAADLPAADRPPADAGGMDAPGMDAPGMDAPGMDAPGMDAPGMDAPVRDVPGTDAPRRDVPADDGPCLLACPAPPPGCRYEGPVTCDPPSCGRVVCEDAGGGGVRCGAGGGGSFPSFDRSCRSPDDCFVAIHQTDCCGNTRALGINVLQRGAFDAAEASCRSMYPACGCPSGPTVADDGMRAFEASRIAVDCRERMCFTFVR